MKAFEGFGVFGGTVVRYDGQYWRVVYDDGDEEDLNFSELQAVLAPPPGEAAAKAEGEVAAEDKGAAAVGALSTSGDGGVGETVGALGDGATSAAMWGPSERGLEEVWDGFVRGELVWVRVQGYPWWPGLVVTAADVPHETRTVGTRHLYLPLPLPPIPPVLVPLPYPRMLCGTFLLAGLICRDS